ncbi:DUF4184 family protein [Acinetobacter sp. ANC 4633]|uniref:DUF4184 family protein n=1 Tax=Acinetobacter sp. ANC 4633 TaxID=2529845 RepID=UPI0022494650|nr:DUF4184 family protein [Acinetobacter sp. ANC 4633]
MSHMLFAPVIYRLSQRQFPLAATGIGCMTPDLFRLFTQQNIMISHLWQGLIFPDLFIGLFFSGLWYGLYRPVMFTGLGLITPLHLHKVKQQGVFCVTTACAVLLGTVSHFFWDSFTHLDIRTWFSRDFLQQQVEIFKHSYPLHYVLQIGTSLLALPWLWIWSKRYIGKYRQNSPSASQRQFLQRLYACSLLCGIGMLSVYLSHHFEFGENSDELIGRSFKAFVQGWLLCFSMGCGLFLWKYSQIQPAKRSLPPH